MIIRRLVVGLYASNCYIVGSEATNEGMVIDPGDNAGDIIKTVEKSGLDIKVIVLTHHHHDHLGALRQVKEATGAELAAHTEMARYLSKPFDRQLKDGDSLDIGDLHFVVLHTPGHSTDGICLAGNGVVFTGDTLFNYSIGRYDLDGGLRQFRAFQRALDNLRQGLI